MHTGLDVPASAIERGARFAGVDDARGAPLRIDLQQAVDAFEAGDIVAAVIDGSQSQCAYCEGLFRQAPQLQARPIDVVMKRFGLRRSAFEAILRAVNPLRWRAG